MLMASDAPGFDDGASMQPRRTVMKRKFEVRWNFHQGATERTAILGQPAARAHAHSNEASAGGRDGRGHEAKGRAGAAKAQRL